MDDFLEAVVTGLLLCTIYLSPFMSEEERLGERLLHGGSLTSWSDDMGWGLRLAMGIMISLPFTCNASRNTAACLMGLCRGHG